MRITKILAILLLIVTFAACQNQDQKSIKKEEAFTGNKVTVLESIDGNTYTYLKLDKDGTEFWAAISKRETKVGEILYYKDALEMQNFESKELGKTFETISFISKISNEPTPQGGGMNSGAMRGKKEEIAKTKILVEPAKNGITIGALYANRDSYSGKSVTIRGKVTKYNSEIMNKNWVHIQDGTGDSNNFDLTVTSLESFTVGDIVTVKGTIAISKDFGAGYFYEVIIESATIVK